MIAYKGFNKNLACTLGRGTYQYEVGRTYREDSAQCVNSGFHCVEEPIEVLRWYGGKTDRYCIVDAGGDINEDGCERIACTEMTILKEISLEQLGALECEWLRIHPEREYSNKVSRNMGQAKENGIVVVRGKNPRAKGEIGAAIFLLKEGKGTNEIISMGAYRIDGTEYVPGIFYNVEGRTVRCARKN